MRLQYYTIIIITEHYVIRRFSSVNCNPDSNMFQEIFGNETLAGLKSNILYPNSRNGEDNNRFGPDPNSGIEMREWVYQCAYERATEIVEKTEVDGRYYFK